MMWLLEAGRYVKREGEQAYWLEGWFVADGGRTG